jgi:hypothetical protein
MNEQWKTIADIYSTHILYCYYVWTKFSSNYYKINNHL